MDFNSMKHFLTVQSPCGNSFFADCNKKFPGKVALINYFSSLLRGRMEKLQQFLTFYLDHSRMLNQMCVDGLLAFLEIPDHLPSSAKQTLSYDTWKDSDVFFQGLENDGGLIFFHEKEEEKSEIVNLSSLYLRIEQLEKELKEVRIVRDYSYCLINSFISGEA
jgi:hypothetical protein